MTANQTPFADHFVWYGF